MPKYTETEDRYRKIVEDARKGLFSQVYLLMGAEPYYPDKACEQIIKYALSDNERDFNQTVLFGPDTDAAEVASYARSYPMMSERRLVVLKEAQGMKTLEQLGTYAAEPTETTVLVILMRGATADKRKALYKTVSKTGVVMDSPALRDYEIQGWITSYYKSLGLDIAPDAAVLLAESVGTSLDTIALETGKLRKSLPEGTTKVSVTDIEKNVGVSRQFSIFELNKELSYKHTPEAFKIAAYVGSAPKFAMPMAIAAIYQHFYKIFRYSLAQRAKPPMSRQEKAGILGINPYFVEEFDVAARNYPPDKCRYVISLLEEYDFKSKGGGGGEAEAVELLTELIAKILL